jgi:hypothetical protein
MMNQMMQVNNLYRPLKCYNGFLKSNEVAS